MPGQVTATEATTEKWLTLGQAARMLSTHPAPSTLWRWARKGLHGVCLEYRRLGGRIVVTEDAIRRFMEKLTDMDAALKTRPSQQAEATGTILRRMSKEDLELALRREGLW